VNSNYVLTSEAEQDLRGIIRYTRKKHGEKQVRTYVSQLKQGIKHLATGKGNSRLFPDIHPDLRMIRCEHHYIFCLVNVNQPVLVIAILHERMDMVHRIRDRLSS
jgi:toxin ParE1/3/4